MIVVPHDLNVYQYDCDGKPIIQLPKESPVRKALHDIVQKLGLYRLCSKINSIISREEKRKMKTAMLIEVFGYIGSACFLHLPILTFQNS